MNTPTHHFAITAATFTGNRGAEAMLLTTIEQLRNRFPACAIHVLSYSPKDDQEWLSSHPINGVYIHDATPKQIVLQWCARSALAAVTRLRPPLAAKHGQSMPALLNVDAVFDLAGVAFIDGREKFLPFNVLTLAPFLINGVPTYKLSQALGPITSIANRLSAKIVLPFCKSVVARGEETHRHLQQFGLTSNLRHAPDVSFLLRPHAQEIIPIQQRTGDIGIIPSSVVSRKRADYEVFLADVIQQLQAQGASVSLIAHSWRSGTQKEFNNDMPLVERILARLPHSNSVRVIGPGLDARGLKAAIGTHKVVVTSRFHGMIAALDTATIPLVLGWSHKYREVLRAFKIEDFAMPTASTDAATLVARTLETLRQASELSAALEAQLPQARQSAQAQYDEILDELQGDREPLRKAS
jgi:colanic acid/amylovoran biosynthesis protein